MLCELFRHEAEPFTVHEIGCSLGHFGKYLAERFPLAAFSGSDVYAPFVETCREAYPAGEFFVRDISETLPDDRYDYLVTCGTYNIANDAPRDEWNEAVCRMATAMYEMANKGFGMTFLTTYHDPAYAREDLYYQSESALMELAFEKLSRHFEIDRSGPLYEYAFRVYTPGYVRSRYPQPAFQKYFKGLG